MTRKVFGFVLVACLLFSLCGSHATAQKKTNGKPDGAEASSSNAFASSAPLQKLVDEAAQSALKRFAEKGFQEKNLAITLVDLRDRERPASASFRGGEPIYPASVVKLFYLAATHRWLEDGKIRDSDELQRAMRDMIVDSSNDATHYIVDVLSGVSNGAELSPAEMRKWAEKRGVVNRYFASLGYTGINVVQKPWCEGPYGRERAFVGQKLENRNKLTTDATARLLTDIVLGRAISPARSAKMLDLMKRDYTGKSSDPDDQAHGFTGIALTDNAGVRLWSKAGWTSTTRHDAAYIEIPDGARFILVTFTTDHANEREIIPTVARVVMAGMSGK
ncbi:MAG TPA: serine hydrolase [Pyrinomonadaceae bacterium]|jgi:hypothetical protein